MEALWAELRFFRFLARLRSEVLTKAHLTSRLVVKMEHDTQTGLQVRLSWTCAILLVLMNFVQAAHVCGFIPSYGAIAQVSDAGPADGFCAICAGSHSPSLAAPLDYLPPVDSLTELILRGLVSRRSVSQAFALYIRPPPSSWEHLPAKS